MKVAADRQTDRAVPAGAGRAAPTEGRVRIGTSGWVYHHWRQVFYPAGLPVKQWFAFYARHFDTVEVNGSFYRMPSAEAFEAWRRQAPPDFVYAVKASRFLTHRKKLKDPEQPLKLLMERVRLLGPDRGPVLYQLPPRWHCDRARLRAFVQLLPLDIRHVFEFRDPTWCDDRVRDLLADAGVSYCIHDMRGFPCPGWVTGPLVYVRFHGPADLKYSGRYSRSHLAHWADWIGEFRRGGRDVYAYFNNDDSGHAVANALELREFVGQPALSVG
jgi:uncharacterized protein YecE (DUF72 family)